MPSMLEIFIDGLIIFMIFMIILFGLQYVAQGITT